MRLGALDLIWSVVDKEYRSRGGDWSCAGDWRGLDGEERRA